MKAKVEALEAKAEAVEAKAEAGQKKLKALEEKVEAVEAVLRGGPAYVGIDDRDTLLKKDEQLGEEKKQLERAPSFC